MISGRALATIVVCVLCGGCATGYAGTHGATSGSSGHEPAPPPPPREEPKRRLSLVTNPDMMPANWRPEIAHGHDHGYGLLVNEMQGSQLTARDSHEEGTPFQQSNVHAYKLYELGMIVGDVTQLGLRCWGGNFRTTDDVLYGMFAVCGLGPGDATPVLFRGDWPRREDFNASVDFRSIVLHSDLE